MMVFSGNQRMGLGSFLFLLLFLLSCSSSSEQNDPISMEDGDDPSSEEDGDEDDDPEEEESVVHDLDLSLPLDETQARAGLMDDESEWPDGEAICATLGDAKLYNGRIGLVISGVGHRCTVAAGGGNLVDAYRIDTEQDGLLEWIPYTGLGDGFVADTLTIENDGTNGEPARVLVTGHLEAMGLLSLALEKKTAPAELEIETTFTLYPNRDFVFVETKATNPANLDVLVRLGDTVHTIRRLQALCEGQAFHESRGLLTASKAERTNQAAWTNQELTYLLFEREESDLLHEPLPLHLSAYSQPDDVLLSSGQSVIYERVLWVGQGDWATNQAQVNDYRRTFSTTGSKTLAPISLSVGFQPRMEDEAAALWMLRPGEDGQYQVLGQSFGIAGESTSLDTEFVETLAVVAQHPSLGIGSPVTLRVRTDRENTATVNLPLGTLVDVSAVDPLIQLDGEVIGMPVKLSVFPLGGLVPEWVLPIPSEGALLHLPLSLNSGGNDVRLVVSHGPVYEIYEETVQLRSGTPLNLSLQMDRVLSRSVAFANRSLFAYGLDLASIGEQSLRGGFDTLRKRRNALAAAGAHLIVEAQTDILPAAVPVQENEAMAVWQRGFAGSLLQAKDGRLLALAPQTQGTDRYDPLNVRDESTGEAKHLAELFPDVFDIMQAQGTVLLEPRFSRNGVGYLDLLGFEPARGLAGLGEAERAVLEGISFLEISSNAVETIAPIHLLHDYAALQNERSPLYLVANSAMDGLALQAGNPGSMIWLGVEALPEESISHVLLTELFMGHLQAGNEALLLYGVDEGLMGDTVAVDGDELHLDLSLQVPVASPVDTLLVCRNGEVLDEVAIAGEEGFTQTETSRSLRQTRNFPAPDKDSWLLLLAYASNGENLVGLTTRKPALVIGQPVYLDVDGSRDSWTPPAQSGAELETGCLSVGLCRAFASAVNPVEERFLPSVCCELDNSLQGCN